MRTATKTSICMKTIKLLFVSIVTLISAGASLAADYTQNPFTLAYEGAITENVKGQVNIHPVAYSCSRFGRVELLISSHPAQAGLFSTRPGENPA